jgi:hypothetical protein
MHTHGAAALAFVGLFVSSAAAAFFTGAVDYVQTQWREIGAVVETAPVLAPQGKSTRGLPRHKQRSKAPAPRPASAVEDRVMAVEVAQPAVEVPVAVGEAAPSQAVGLSPSTTRLVTPAGLAPASASSERARQAASEALFASANAARAASDYAMAEARYARLSQLYPGTRAELVSRVSRGNLWLARSASPERARSAFASYLTARPNGTLAEEARAGLARSLGLLGRDEDERAAWAELISRHPSSLHAAYARARLAELSR